MKKPLYIVRGTGLVIDGTIVVIVENMGDYSVISQPNLPTPTTNIMVKNKCLQEIGEVDPITYKFSITKYQNYENPETKEFHIDSAIRNVNLDTIIDFLDKTMTPILRMEG